MEKEEIDKYLEDPEDPEDPEDQEEEFQAEVAPSEFSTTLEDVSRIMFQNKGIIKGIRC